MIVADDNITRCPKCGRGTWCGTVEYMVGDPGRQLVHGVCSGCGFSEDVLEPFDIIDLDTDGRCPIHWVSRDRGWYAFREDVPGYDPLGRGEPVAARIYVGNAEYGSAYAMYRDGTMTEDDYGHGPGFDREMPPAVRGWVRSILMGCI